MIHKKVLLISFSVVLCAVGSAQELRSVKVKAFVDETHRPYELRLPLDMTTIDNGNVAAFYPEKALQPAFVDQKHGPDKPMIVSWSRDKVQPSVDKDPYLVYGRTALTPMAFTRFQDHTYLLCLQDRGADKLGIIRSTIEGAGMTPTPCQELCEMPVTIKDVKDDKKMRSWGYTPGLHVSRSKSGNTMLISMVGSLSNGAKYAPLSMAILDKELLVKWQDVLYLGDDERGTNILDMLLVNDSTLAVLTGWNTKDPDGTMENRTRLHIMGPGVMNNTEIDMKEHYIQDARLRTLPEGGIQCVGITGQKKAKDQKTVGAFSLNLNADLTVASTNLQPEEHPSEELELVGVDLYKDGGYITTLNYEIKGTASGAGGTQLKNIKYHTSSMQVHHMSSNGSFSKTKFIPMGAVGQEIAEIVPVSMVHDGDLFLVMNDDLDNIDKRKKGQEVKSSESGDYGVLYIQLNSKGDMYSRPILKGDDPMKSIFAWQAWQISETELFTLVKEDPKKPEFHLMKILLEPESK